MDLEHPEITWAERTGYPSWAQEGYWEEEDGGEIGDLRYEISDVVSPSGMVLKGWDDCRAMPSPGGKGDREAVDEEWRHLTILNAVKSKSTTFSNVPF